MSQSSTPGGTLPVVTDSGRSRMSIPNLVHGVTAADGDMYGERRIFVSNSTGDKGGGGGGGRGREEAGSSSAFHSPPDGLGEFSSSQRTLPAGPRYYCSYAHPLSGKRCVSWPQGFSSQSDLSRHYMNIHGQEEIRMIRNGALNFEHAQVVNTPEKFQRLETHFSSTKYCESCGTAFSSGRRDAISRHVRKGACGKKMDSLRNSPS